MRVALLGGSFDPIHEGHLHIAKTALRKLPIDQVWFLPCRDAPLKQGQQASFGDRCAMVLRAIHPYRSMKLCRIEGELEGVSYTIRTIQALKKRYAHITFSFLIGDDQAQQFHRWKDSEQLLKEVTFYVFSRQQDAMIPNGMRYVEMDLIDVSSTMIRQGRKRWLLPKAVKRYIGQQGLYMEETVRSYIQEQRFLHSRSVAALCVALAKAHHLDEKIAWQMGIAHDIAKQLPKAQADIWMRYLFPEKRSQAVGIWHGYIGAYLTKHVLYVEDHHILSAIGHHVLGDGHSPYDIILYVADKLDPTRGYDVEKQISLCERDLKQGLACVRQEQQEYLRKEGVIT